VDLSLCIVNTNGREHVLRCLAAIRANLPEGGRPEVLLLDNASDDGSVAAVRSWNDGPDGLGDTLRVLLNERRLGKAENDTRLLREASGELCLLLNEDSELRPGAIEALVAALAANPDAAVAGAQLVAPDGSHSACAWRLPGVGTALAQALFLHRVLVTQSGRGADVRRVGWVQSSAMLVRRSAAEQAGYLDPAFFVYSDETDFCKRLADAGWSILHVPDALAVHHEQLTFDRSAGQPRVVEFHRNRDLYMRKHHGAAAALAVRVLTAWNYAARTVVAAVVPGQSPGWYWLHARKALRPTGPGIREAAEEHNRRLDQAVAEGGTA
jgi:N-acetylglucosaminyl-diphospho-decaprenol L-rhamnosyltransferase